MFYKTFSRFCYSKKRPGAVNYPFIIFKPLPIINTSISYNIIKYKVLSK